MKNKSLSSKTGILITAIILLVSLITTVQARELTLKEAIEWGKENSFYLKQKREEVAAVERELKTLEASLDWQLGFGGNASYSNGPEFTGLISSLNPEDVAEEGGSLSLGLKGNKSYRSGLNISTNYTLLETTPFEFDNLEDKYNFSLDVSKRLYPLVPTEIEKKIIQTENNLLAVKAELEQEIGQKEIDWVEGFLNLDILQKRVKAAESGYRLAREKLERVKEQEAIGEAGREQVLIAEIGLREASLSLEQSRNGLKQATKKLYLDLGLPVDNSFSIEYPDEYLESIANRAKGIEVDLDNEEKLLELLEKNNPGLKKLRLELEYTRKSLEWEQKEGNINITAVGNYDQGYLNGKADWSVGLNFSYDIFDGGQQKIALESLQSTLELMEEQYQNTLEGLKVELQSLVEGLQLASMNVKTRELATEKASLEMKLYQEQHEKGLISEIDFKQKGVQNCQIEIDYQEARNELLISRLRLLNFLGLY
jgi:outer membrane protein TolC